MKDSNTATKVADKSWVTITYRAPEQHRVNLHIFVAETRGETQQSVCIKAVERYIAAEKRRRK